MWKGKHVERKEIRVKKEENARKWDSVERENFE
jgi:hypothetical protein